jgi:hypothetical protein
MYPFVPEPKDPPEGLNVFHCPVSTFCFLETLDGALERSRPPLSNGGRGER